MSPRILFSALALAALAGSASAEVVVVVPGTAYTGSHESAVRAAQDRRFVPPAAVLGNRCNVACALVADNDRPATCAQSTVAEPEDPSATPASRAVQVAGFYSPDVEAWAASEGSPLGLGMTYDRSGDPSRDCAPSKWQAQKK